MITVTRLNGTRVTINALFIEMVEETPDTVITLNTGKIMVVTEKTAEIVTLTQQYFREIGLIAATAKLQQLEDS
jgi:flagellar protein FlbD